MTLIINHQLLRSIHHLSVMDRNINGQRYSVFRNPPRPGLPPPRIDQGNDVISVGDTRLGDRSRFTHRALLKDENLIDHNAPMFMICFEDRDQCLNYMRCLQDIEIEFHRLSYPDPNRPLIYRKLDLWQWVQSIHEFIDLFGKDVVLPQWRAELLMAERYFGAPLTLFLPDCRPAAFSEGVTDEVRDIPADSLVRFGATSVVDD